MRIGFFNVTMCSSKNNEEGVVYLVYDKYFKRYKVGFTQKKASERMQQIQNASGTELVLINTFEGSRKNEKKLHEYLKKYRIKGEWYKDEKQIEALFERFLVGVMTGITYDESYGQVNSYNIEILKEVFQI